MWGELALSLQQGNYYVVAILALAFIGTVIVFERLIMLSLVYNLEFPKFLLNLRKMIISEDYERAMNFCKSVSKTSIPKIALRALEARETDPSTIRGTIEEDTIEFVPKLEARLGALPSIATMIMLIGILGTIDQLWWAFHSIDVLDTTKKQASLSNGIATALNPTALGLMVCMFTLVMHQFIKGMALRLVEQTHHGVAVLTNLLAPPEVALAVGTSAPAKEIDFSAKSEPAAAAPANDDQEALDDAFNDASVEDIKDEEEII